MKKMMVVTALLCAAGMAKADYKYCESKDSRVQVRMSVQDKDVLISIAESKFSDHGKVGNPMDGYLQVKSQEAVNLTVSGISLEQLLAKKSAAAEVVAKGLFTMGMYDGEYDMIYSYASDYVAKLVCHKYEQP